MNSVSGACVGAMPAGAVSTLGRRGPEAAVAGPPPSGASPPRPPRPPRPPPPPPPPPGASGTGGIDPDVIALICASALSILIWRNTLPSAAVDFDGSPLTPLFSYPPPGANRAG